MTQTARETARETAPADLGLGRPRHRAALSLAPLIDVTFILLIFFMLVTQFSRFAPLDLALARVPDVVERPAHDEGRGPRDDPVLRIQAEGTLRLQDREIVGPEALIAALTAYQAGFVASPSQPEPLLLVKPDRDVPLQLLVDVLVSLQDAPGMSLRLIIPEAEEARP